MSSVDQMLKEMEQLSAGERQGKLRELSMQLVGAIAQEKGKDYATNLYADFLTCAALVDGHLGDAEFDLLQTILRRCTGRAVDFVQLRKTMREDKFAFKKMKEEVAEEAHGLSQELRWGMTQAALLLFSADRHVEDEELAWVVSALK